MNRKKVAWLLTAAMVATSVDSSALVASGADFTSEPVENVQDFSDETTSQSGETETVSPEEAAGTADETIGDATEATVSASDGTETVSADQEAGTDGSEEQTTSTEEEENVTADLTADQDLTLGDGTEEITQTPQDSGQGGDNNGNEDITDPDKGSETETFSSDSQISVASAKTIQSIEVNKPEIDLCIGQDRLYKRALLDQVKLEITYTDGSGVIIPVTSNRDDINVDYSSVIFDEGGDAKEGEYTIPISMEDQKTEVKIKIQKFADFYNEHSTELTFNQECSTTVSEIGYYYYKFTAPEDSFYTFRYRAMEDGVETGECGYEVRYFDSDGYSIEERSELKAGDVVYVRMEAIYGTRYDFCITPIQKNYILSSLQVESEPTDKMYVEGLDFRYGAVPKTAGLKVKASYSDGVEETLGAEDISRDGKTLQISIENEYDYDSGTESYVMKIYLDNENITVPVTYMTLPQYISSADKDSIETLELNVDKEVQWSGEKGYLYRFKPDKDGEYIFMSEGDEDTDAVLMDGEGNSIADDDQSGTDGNFKLSYTLEAGKTYYYLARPWGSSNRKATLKLYKKDSIAKADIKNPDKTSFIAGMEDINYAGLEVGLTFESGKKLTYVYGEDDFWEHIDISCEYEYDDDYTILPGNYTATVAYEGEEIGSFLIKVQTLADYMAENKPKELKEGQDIKENHMDGEMEYYSFTAPETGEYLFRTNIKMGEEISSSYNSDCVLYDSTGKNISQGSGRLSAQLEAGKTYYMREVFWAYEGGACEYTISVQARRTLKEIVLSSTEKDLYAGIDEISESVGYDLLNSLKYTLKFTNGTEETISYGDTTEDGYSLRSEEEPELSNAPGKYVIRISCGDINTEYIVNIHSIMDYFEKNGTELQSNKRTPVRISASTTQAYYVTVPETGYYKISYLGNTPAKITYYDQQGKAQTGAVKVEKGQKFYFTLKNNEYERTIRALVTAETQEAVLEKLTVKTLPSRTTLIKYLDYDYTPENAENYTDGMSVTAQYTDGKTEVLKFGDTSRFGSRLSAGFQYDYDEETGEVNKCSLIVSMDGTECEEIPMKLTGIKQYLKDNGDKLESLKLNTDKVTAVKSGQYQLYSFTPEKDGTYTFFSKGNTDTYGNLYNADGDSIGYDDDNGYGLNFLMQQELTAGTRYYLGVKGYQSGDTTLQVTDGSGNKDEEEDKNPELSDFKLVSMPKNTVFYGYNSEGFLDPAYNGLKVSAKNKAGKTHVYTYGNGKFPFMVLANIERDEDFPVAGKYTASVIYNEKEVLKFPVEVKAFKDYLDENTTVLKPGETVTEAAENPMTNGNLCYFKLPSDLKGVYWNSGDTWKWSVYGIYDSEGNRTKLEMGKGDSWDFAGKDYYLCLKDNSSSQGIFSYARMDDGGIIKDMEIISQPEVTEFLKGMDESLDLTGMVLRIRYEDGTVKKVPVSEAEDLYGREAAVLNEDGERIFNISELHDGTNDLNIEFGGIKKSFQLTLTDPAKKDADVLAIDKMLTFSVSENTRSHIYSYTPDKDGDYYFQTETGSHSSSGLSDGLKWFCTDAERDYFSRGNNLYLEAGKTYYFVVYYNGSAFGDVSVKLQKLSYGVKEDTDVVDMEITPPTKTEYTTDEKISYEGMKIHAIYDDGTEKEYTAEEAEKLGFDISNTVDICAGKNLPGKYKIIIEHTSDTDFSVTKTVPITVDNTGVSSVELSEKEVEVKAEKGDALYEYQVNEDGYYQLAIAVKTGGSAEGSYIEYCMREDTSDVVGVGRKVHSSVVYLKAGKHYIYLNNYSDETEICGLKLYHYSSSPKKIEVVQDSAKTDFVYGRDEVNFAGMKVKITYTDGAEKIVTVPDEFGRGGKTEGGLDISYISDEVGTHELELSIAVKNEDDYWNVNTSMEYTVHYPDNMTELETGKTHTIKADTLKKQSAIYTVKGSGNDLCEIQYEGSENIDIWDENGDHAGNVKQYTDQSGSIYFMAEREKTYHIVISKNESLKKDMTIKLSEKKSVTKVTALPEQGVIYYYGDNEKARDNIRIQLTYDDGSTEILDKNNIKFWLTDLNMENISGPGTYSGVLSIGNVKTIYRREIQDPSAEEIKKDQNVKLNGNEAIRRLKFVPEKTQKYYIQVDTPYDCTSVNCKNAEGAYLGGWYINSDMNDVTNAGDEILEMVLTAGKTYYFDINCNNNGGGGTFVITDQKPVIAEFVKSRFYTYTGSEIKPELKVTYNGKELTEGKDYQLKYTNNINVGTAQVEIMPVSGGINFAMRTMVFDIGPQSLETAKAVIEPIPDQQYTGNSLTPEVKVSVGDKTLVLGKDYEVSYKDNIEPGTAEVTVEGDGNYHGTVTGTFKIVKNKKDFTKAEISGIAASYDYTGKAITPAPVVKYEGKTLKAGTDYNVTYVNNTKAGTATVKITGKGDYEGEKSINFRIAYKQVIKITLNKTSATITAGSSLQLKATATPSDAYNKSVKWTSSNTSLATVTSGGKVTVKSTATGGSTVKITATAADGSKKSAVCTIKINNKITYNLNGGKQNSKNKTTFCKQTVKLYNPTRSGYTFGGWYTDKGLKKKSTSITSKTVKNVTLYAKWVKVSKCKAPAGVKAANSKAKTVTVSYKAASGAKGYEISYSTSAKFSGAKKILTTARSKAIGSLKKGATYYVRVRAYKTDSTGAKIYGSYSNAVKVTVKK